jgi:probable rRNA maturation factor
MIVNRQRAVRVARPPLESFLRRVKNDLGLGEASLTVCLVSDAEIARMNETFRKKKGPTDVLSFPSEKKWRVASGPDPVGVNEWREKRRKKKRREGALKRPRRNREFNPEALAKRRGVDGFAAGYLGDIAIAPSTARRYAKKNGRKLGDEIRVLMLHGVLHLMGYDHETDRGEMERVERKLRRRLGLA